MKCLVLNMCCAEVGGCRAELDARSPGRRSVVSVVAAVDRAQNRGVGSRKRRVPSGRVQWGRWAAENTAWRKANLTQLRNMATDVSRVASVPLCASTPSRQPRSGFQLQPRRGGRRMLLDRLCRVASASSPRTCLLRSRVAACGIG